MAILVDIQVQPSFDTNPIVTMTNVSVLPEEIAQDRVPAQRPVQRTTVTGRNAKVRITVLHSRSTELKR